MGSIVQTNIVGLESYRCVFHNNLFKMLKLILIFSFLTVTLGMDCSLGTSKNSFDKFIQTCPRILIDNSEDEYCCPDPDGVRCCNLQNFIWQWLVAAWPIILLVLLVLAILSCICCCLRHICR